MRNMILVTLLTCLGVAGCSSTPTGSIESDFNKFEDVSSCKLKNLDIRSQEGVWMRFFLNKAKAHDNNDKADYYIAATDTPLDKIGVFTDLNAFCLGENLWLTIDDSKTIKLKLGSVAFGKYTQQSATGFGIEHAYLTPEHVNLLKNAQRIKFEASKCDALAKKYKSIQGEFTSSDLDKIKRFFQQC